MVSRFFAEGGAGMFPTLVFGFFLIAASVLFTLRLERRFLHLVASLGVLVLVSGLLGFLTSVTAALASVSGAPENEPELRMLLAGLAESMANLDLAFCFLTLAALVAAVGFARLARTPAVS